MESSVGDFGNAEYQKEIYFNWNKDNFNLY